MVNRLVDVYWSFEGFEFTGVFVLDEGAYWVHFCGFYFCAVGERAETLGKEAEGLVVWISETAFIQCSYEF